MDRAMFTAVMCGLGLRLLCRVLDCAASWSVTLKAAESGYVRFETAGAFPSSCGISGWWARSLGLGKLEARVLRLTITSERRSAVTGICRV